MFVVVSIPANYLDVNSAMIQQEIDVHNKMWTGPFELRCAGRLVYIRFFGFDQSLIAIVITLCNSRLRVIQKRTAQLQRTKKWGSRYRLIFQCSIAPSLMPVAQIRINKIVMSSIWNIAFFAFYREEPSLTAEADWGWRSSSSFPSRWPRINRIWPKDPVQSEPVKLKLPDPGNSGWVGRGWPSSPSIHPGGGQSCQGKEEKLQHFSHQWANNTDQRRYVESQKR